MNETKNEEPKRNKLTFYMKTFYIIGLFLVVVAVGSYLFGNYMINKQIHQVRYNKTRFSTNFKN